MDDAARQRLEAETRYDPALVEPAMFARWQDTGAFAVEPDDPGEPFVVALPPPNVTGSLHMGHALNGSMQDAIIRMRRMQGRKALWICGTDHAGIATQNVVERMLARVNLTREELGREEFVRRVWNWREESGATIIDQFQQLGCSLDYEHERFTMDDEYARAVIQVFVELHRRGYLYRANRMVNWCTVCSTAISDLEVEHIEVDDTLYSVDYPLVGGGHVTVATVRPVTLLGDTAVAVNPSDERYRQLIGQRAIVPLVGREVPIVGDEHVDPAVGTGALKVTPGHDPNDLEIARRHGLEEIAVIGFDGRMTDAAGERYAGQTSKEAQKLVIADLREQGLLRDEQPWRHSVGHCSRSGNRVEPLVSLQWFCEMGELAAPAIASVREGRVRFIPKSRERIFFDWMEQIRPWCVSRQLWWGHQLPVWYCSCGETIVQAEPPVALPELRTRRELERDPDVLDTWFSSALWPFATLGWPDDTRADACVLSRPRTVHGTRHHQPLGRADDHAGHRIHARRRGAVPRRDHPPHGARPRRPADVEVARHRCRSPRPDREARRGRDALRAAQDELDAGRALLRGRDRGGPRAHQQALECRAPDPAQRRSGCRTGGFERGARRRLGARPARGRDGRGDRRARRLRLRRGGQGALPLHLERRLRLVPRSREAAPLRRRRRRAARRVADAAARARRDAPPRAPGAPARDRANLGRARRETVLARGPWPEAVAEQRDSANERAVEQAFDFIVKLRQLRAVAQMPPRAPLALEGWPLAAVAALVEKLGGVSLVADGSGDWRAVDVIAVGDVPVTVLAPGGAENLRPRLEQELAKAEGEIERARKKLADERFVERAPAHLVDGEREKLARFEREAAELRTRLEALE